MQNTESAWPSLLAVVAVGACVMGLIWGVTQYIEAQEQEQLDRICAYDRATYRYISAPGCD